MRDKVLTGRDKVLTERDKVLTERDGSANSIYIYIYITKRL